MVSQLRPALVLFVLLSLITGVVYPLAITGVAQVVFRDRANGSILLGRDGEAVGSSLIGQEFAAGDAEQAARWFWGRPSATGPLPYGALRLDVGAGSSGSNLGASNPALIENVKGRVAALEAADAAAGVKRAERAAERPAIPVDLVTASGSGLDPHISPAAAEYQVPRVAQARGLSEDVVRTLVRRYTSGRTLGVLGEERVNVLELNVALEQGER